MDNQQTVNQDCDGTICYHKFNHLRLKQKKSQKAFKLKTVSLKMSGDETIMRVNGKCGEGDSIRHIVSQLSTHNDKVDNGV